MAMIRINRNHLYYPQVGVLTGGISAVSDKILQLVGRELGGEWKAFAIGHLDLTYSSIQKYEEENPKDITIQAFTALRRWRDKLGKKATLTVLREKLIQYEKKSIADALDDVASKN